MRNFSLPVAALLLASAACSGPPATAPGAAGSVPAAGTILYKTGAAKVDVTPPEPIHLSGYFGRPKPFEGVEQRLFARAVAFEDAAGARALIVSVESIGLTPEITETAAARIEKELGVPRDRFALCSTHDHCAPALKNNLETMFDLPKEEWDAIARYSRLLSDRVVEAARAAVKDLAPAALSHGWGTAPFALNRRLSRPGGVGFGLNWEGPVDHDVPVLRVVAPDGRLRAILFGYACHCVTLGPNFNKVCGDWAGYAQECLEEDHPGAVAACLIGCGADANPEPRLWLYHAKQHGRTMADAVAAVLRDGPMRPIAGPVAGTFSRIDLPFADLPSKETLQKRLAEGKPPDKALAARLLEQIDRQGALSPTLPCPVQTIRFGDSLTFVILGGEVVVDYALRLKRELDPARLWVVAYANDVPCYIPSARVLAEGGYEADNSMLWYGRPSRFKPEVEELVVRQVHASVTDAYRRPLPISPMKSPVPPPESLNYMDVEPGFEVDLVASEPFLRDPVHLSWDARGRMYVTEMIDYPLGPPGGRVVRLEDTDGDGRMDRETVFADHLGYPTSATPWRNGILVTSAPDILYFEDTDGDGRADVRRIVFTGFSKGNTQHRVNNLQWGLDNRYYGGNGDSSETVTAPGRPERPPVQVTYADFRFRPDTGEFETLVEHGGFALAFDDIGARFASTSTGDIRHVMFDPATLERNPLVPGTPGSRRLEGRVPLHPVNGQTERFNDPRDLGFFTAASGLAVYRGGIFPQVHHGNTFIGESAGNVVHRDLLVRDGAAWRAGVHTQPADFLASRDPWFRPVFLATGPDGCLYVADMYRAVIEHPEWIPDDIEKTLDLRAGENEGRVYRIRHRSHAPLPVEALDRLPDAALAARLESPNGWVRDTAQRLLVERQDAAAVAPLRRAASDAASPLARVHALWTLDGLGADIPEPLVAARLKDPDARVRETMLRVLDARAARGAPVPVAAVLPLAQDAALPVRFRLACLLGRSDAPEAVAALGDLLFDKANDDWIRHAALHARPAAMPVFLARLAERIGADAAESARMSPWVRRVARVIGARRDAAETAKALDLLLPQPGRPAAGWRLVGLGGGIVSGAGERDRNAAKRVRGIAAGLPGGDARLAQTVAAAAKAAGDGAVPEDVRYDALRLLALDGGGGGRETLGRYLDPAQPPTLQDGAIGAVGDLDLGADAARLLLDRWPGYAPAQKRAALDALFRRPDRLPPLVDALEAKTVLPAELADGHKEQLRRLADEALRGRAEAALAAKPRTDRQKVVEEHQGALQLKGRRAEGLALFNGRARCAECHPVQGVGPQVGPDLVSVRKRERATLLMDILDPNASVAPNFMSYLVTAKDGVIQSGLIASQTASGVVLRQQGGKEMTVPRAEIAEIRPTGQSLMPEGMETTLSDQDLADVIEYLRQIQ